VYRDDSKLVGTLTFRQRSRWPYFLSFAVWGILFGPSLVTHMASSWNPLVFNDDVRQQIWPFFRYYVPGSFPDDFIGSYYLHAFLPIGYRAVYSALALVVDPAAVSKVVPYVCLVGVITACTLTARKLGGTAAFFATGALCFSARLPLDRMVGGLPRAFGFPVVALALYALVCERAWLLVGAVLFGAAFYPPAAVAPGIALVLWFLIIPPRASNGGGSASAVTNRLALIGGTTACSVLLLLPAVLGGRTYGERINPTDIAGYPEVGPAGRYSSNARAPFPDLLPEGVQQAAKALQSDGAPFAAAPRAWLLARGGRRPTSLTRGLLWLTLLGFSVLATRDPHARRVVFLIVGAGISFLVSKTFAPAFFLPQRQLLYTVPVLVWVLLPCSAAVFGGLLPTRARHVARPGFVLAVTGVSLIFLGGRIGSNTGLTVQVSGRERIYPFIATLPETALIAGWPQGVMDNVPYLSRRQILLSWETHQAFHTRYADEMRRRMGALIDAIFAVDEGPLISLRDTFHVTHLIVDLRQLNGGASRYFQPFTDAVRAAHDRGRHQGFIVPKLLLNCVVFRDGPLAVLDLSKLPPDVSS
jgi:hypothetical protein